MTINSIRFKNTVIFTIIMTILFIIFGIILYINLQNMLSNDIDTFLQATAVNVADTINTLWDAERTKNVDLDKKSSIDDTISKYFPKIIKSWISSSGIEDPKYLNLLLQIFDKKGQLIVSSRYVPHIIQKLSDSSFVSVFQGKKYFEDIDIEVSSGKSLTLRFLTIPIMIDNNISYIVRVGISFRSMSFSQKNLQLVLFIILPLTIIISSFIILFITSLTLNPVNKIINTIRQITAKNLKLRIDIPESKDEIRKLADTFNEMLERLEKAFISQKQLIEDLYHELKTPLSIIRGEIEITLKKERDEKTYKNILFSNIEEIDKLSKVIENLLLISKFESKLIFFNREKIFIKELLKEIINTFNILTEPRNISINLSSDNSLFIFGDLKQIKTLFINIIDNAIKYNKENGKIDITINKELNNLVIKINDTGIGIPEKEIPFVFDRYYRAIKTKKMIGTGLGLNISQSIIEAHNGKINVKSKVNEGSEFIIILPINE
jgi:heavy metal sensor kinase